MTQFSVFRDQPLGSGASATVYRGFDTVRGDYVAVKVAHIGGLLSSDAATAIEEFTAEFRALTGLRHDNIVSVRHLEVDPSSGSAAIVMEWLPSGSIASLLERTGYRLHEMVTRRYFRDALLGLQFLHGRRVLHRDVKAANLLLSSEGKVKLSDFGTCKFLSASQARLQSQATKSIVGTPAYMAPELISEGKHGRGADVWALACTVVEMASGRPPWWHLKDALRQPVPLMFHIGTAKAPRHHPRLPKILSPQLRSILERMFAMKPRHRPSAADLLAEPYFSDMTGLLDGMEPIEEYGLRRSMYERSCQKGVEQECVVEWSDDESVKEEDNGGDDGGATSDGTSDPEPLELSSRGRSHSNVSALSRASGGSSMALDHVSHTEAYIGAPPRSMHQQHGT